MTREDSRGARHNHFQRQATNPVGPSPLSDDTGRTMSQDIFADNVDCIIDNPLSYYMPETVDNIAREFAKECGLGTRSELFVKAGRILQDPRAWRSVPGLTDEEKEVLAFESRNARHIRPATGQRDFLTVDAWRKPWQDVFPSNGFWSQPKQLRSTIITLCVAAVAQGWCQAGSNGANLSWAGALLRDLGGSHVPECTPLHEGGWIFALVNAAPYFAASLVGCWLSDPLSEYFLGRRAPIAVSALAIVGAAIGSAYAHTWQELFICRLILGIGMGCKAAVVPVFAAEIAPPHLRGTLVMNWQVFDAFGIFLGFSANLIAARVGASAWRWQFASAALPALVLLGQLYAAPESPRFLMKQRKYTGAYRTLLSLRGESILAAKELLYAHCQMDQELRLLSLARQDAESSNGIAAIRSQGKNINYAQKFRSIFTKPRIRRAAVASIVVMLAQQLCGVNVLAFYSSTLYIAADGICGGDSAHAQVLDQRRALWLSWGIGVANFLFAFPAYWLIDRRGRRWLLLVTLPFMAVCMLAAGLSFDAKDNARVPVVSFFTYLFIFWYSWGLGPVAFTYSAECFPLEIRMVGMSFSVFTNFFAAGVLALFVPALTQKRIGHTGLLCLFAGLIVVAFILVFLFVPETVGAAIGNDPANDLGSMTSMSLEELNYIFGVRTRRHINYQFREVLHYFWQRYVLRNKDAEEPLKLYQWPPQRDLEMGAYENPEDRMLDLNGIDGSGRLS